MSLNIETIYKILATYDDVGQTGGQTGGQMAGHMTEHTIDLIVSGFNIDSRHIKTNEVFIAICATDLKQNNLTISIKGDGHDFVNEAFKNGACLAIVNHLPQNLNTKFYDKVIVVKDCVQALKKLADFKRSQIGDQQKIVAVTGSMGKTSTKEMCGQLLAQFGPTCYSVKSYNNYLGVCLSILKLQNHEYGVFEIGMNHRFEIAALSDIVKPHFAIITTIAPAHIGNLGSIEQIILEKADIVRHLQPNGLVFINGDLLELDALKNAILALGITATQIICVGKNLNNNVRLINAQTVNSNQNSCTELTSVKIAIQGQLLNEEFDYELNFVGDHQVHNSLYAIALANSLGLNLKQACKAMTNLKVTEKRGEFIWLQLKTNNSEVESANSSANTSTNNNSNKLLIYDDSYNANPEAMIKTLDYFTTYCQQIKTLNDLILVISEMNELGEFHDFYHSQLGKKIATLPIAKIFIIGVNIQALVNQLRVDQSIQAFESIEALIPAVLATAKTIVKANQAYFIKGSNSWQLCKLVDALKNLAIT